jgi:hypothetical protein
MRTDYGLFMVFLKGTLAVPRQQSGCAADCKSVQGGLTQPRQARPETAHVSYRTFGYIGCACVTGGREPGRPHQMNTLRAHFVLLICLLTAPPSALAINKCTESDGSTTFRDGPCPKGSKATEKVIPRESSSGFDRTEGSRTADEPFAVIKAKCAADWPKDFQMRAYCETKQTEGLRSVIRPLRVPKREADIILLKCADDWPDDFQMRAYCHDKQVEGLRALRRP